MEITLSLMVGLLFGAGLYLILHRHFFKLILGLMFFSTATNLFIFVIGRLTRGGTPIIEQASEKATEPFSDPVPQALLLTAIVIGFAIIAFAIVLIRRVYQVLHTNDMDSLNETDKIEQPIYPHE